VKRIALITVGLFLYAIPLHAQVINCAPYASSSGSTQIASCAKVIPSSSIGATLDVRAGYNANAKGPAAAQTWDTDAFSGVTQQIDWLCGLNYTVSANSTIPSNVHLMAGQGCNFSVNNGVTFTVTGPMEGSSSTQHFSGTGTVTIANQAVNAQWFGGGSDVCTQMNLAAVSTPSTGGTVDARGFTGTRTCSSSPFSGITKPITLLFGSGIYNISVGSWDLPDSTRVLGQQNGTLLNFTGSGYLFDIGATEGPNHVEIGNFSVTTSTSSTGFLRVGRTSQDYGNYQRLWWSIHDLYILGQGQSGVGAIGMSVTEYLDWVVTNIDIVNFETAAIFDRGGNSLFNRARFHAYEFGPKWTIQGGTGTAAPGGNQDQCNTCEFLGPTWGRGDTVTVQTSGIIFINALYETQPGGTSTAMLHLASRGLGFADSSYFTDINGAFSLGGVGTVATIAMDSGFASPRFIGSVVAVAGAAPITFGTIYSSSGADDFTAKFINCTYQLNALVKAADATGANAEIIAGPDVEGGAGRIRTQSQNHDQTGLFRVVGQNGYTPPVSSTARGLELQYQDPSGGDQSLIASFDRAAGVYKPLTTQGSVLIDAPGGSEINRFTPSGMALRGGVQAAAESPGMQHLRVSTGPINASSSADVTVTWTTAFANTSYSATCTVQDPGTANTLQVTKIETINTGSVVVRVANNDRGAAHTGVLHCIALHD
jgi:hypothetical protein